MKGINVIVEETEFRIPLDHDGSQVWAAIPDLTLGALNYGRRKGDAQSEPRDISGG